MVHRKIKVCMGKMYNSSAINSVLYAAEVTVCKRRLPADQTPQNKVIICSIEKGPRWYTTSSSVVWGNTIGHSNLLGFNNQSIQSLCLHHGGTWRDKGKNDEGEEKKFAAKFNKKKHHGRNATKCTKQDVT